MIASAWFETTGRNHWHSFFSMIESAMVAGRLLGLGEKRIDADELLRIYRGEPAAITDEQGERIRKMREDGMAVARIAELFGTNDGTISYILETKTRRARGKRTISK